MWPVPLSLFRSSSRSSSRHRGQGLDASGVDLRPGPQPLHGGRGRAAHRRDRVLAGNEEGRRIGLKITTAGSARLASARTERARSSPRRAKKGRRAGRGSARGRRASRRVEARIDHRADAGHDPQRHGRGDRRYATAADILHKLQPPAGALASRPQESSTSPQKGLALSAEESVAVLARPVEPRRET